MVPNARTSVDRVAAMLTVQSSAHVHAYTHAQKNKSTVKSEVRGYIHNNKNKTKTCTRTVRNGSIRNWTRATPKLWNEVTLSSANAKFNVTGLLLVPPLRPPGFPGNDVCAHSNSHTRTYEHTEMNAPTRIHEKNIHWSVLEDLQEERGEQLGGTLHFHVEEAAGVAGTDHPQVCHLH